MRQGRGSGSSERELSSPVQSWGDSLAWEPNRSSPAAASRRGLRRRSSLRFDPRVATIVTSGRQAFVTMVQAAHLGERDDLALLRTLYWSWFRGIFVQPQMGSTAVVVREIGFE